MEVSSANKLDEAEVGKGMGGLLVEEVCWLVTTWELELEETMVRVVVVTVTFAL